jgi:hypothetical protein
LNVSIRRAGFAALYEESDPMETKREAVTRRVEQQTRAALQMLLDEEGAPDEMLPGLLEQARPVMAEIVDDWFRRQLQ